MELMTQDERLTYLVEAFKQDSGEYRDLETPAETEGKRRLLRALMNIRPPRPAPAAMVEVQDAYLQARARERCVVTLGQIPTLAELGSRCRHADRLSLWQGDITRLALDAIVNAANSQMLGCFVPMHSCIDNCIHTYAGIQLRAACDRQMQRLRAQYGPDYEQPTAVPMLTDGYNLPAKKVVHIVGPIVADRLTPELELQLCQCYSRTLELCREAGLRTVAFCCISTGVFCFPNERAAEIAVQTVSDWLDRHPDGMDRVVFNVFGDRDLQLYRALLTEN